MSYAFAGKIVPGHLYQATQHSNQQPNELKRYRITTNGATFRTGITHRPGASQHHSDSSNPTGSTGVDGCQTGDMRNPSVLTIRATRKTNRFGVRDAKYNAAGAMHRVAWALQNSKAIGQKCEKPWENQGFAAWASEN